MWRGGKVIFNFTFAEQCQSLPAAMPSMATAASVAPASSRGSQLPRMFLLPWSGEGDRSVPVWAYQCVWAERSKRVLVLLPSKPSEDSSQSIIGMCESRYPETQVQLKQKTKSDPLLFRILWLLQQCQERVHSFGNFTAFYFSQPCNNRSWFLAFELLLSN